MSDPAVHPTTARTEPYQPTNHVRIVTAASLFDGHDAAINIMRRILQASGAEVIHLGHNRSVKEIVDCAIQEDAQGIAITSYQGGHVEYLKYMFDLVKESGVDIRIFAGGGGTIHPKEVDELHTYGIARIFSPDDGREMGLQGMINDVMRQCDFEVGQAPTSASVAGYLGGLEEKDPRALGRLISLAENFPEEDEVLMAAVREAGGRIAGTKTIPVLGITGTGGAGKSSLVDELVRRFLADFQDKTIAIVSVDPSRRRSGGALLGDRIRMNAIDHPRVFGFDLVIVETSGIGQSDTEITEHSDVSLYVMTAEYGAATQLEKIDMLDFADLIAINKFDHRGSLDALRDVRKQYRRNHNLFEAEDDQLPVYGTIASQFNDPGMNELYEQAELHYSAREGAVSGGDRRGQRGVRPVRGRAVRPRAAVVPAARHHRSLAGEHRQEDRRSGGFGSAGRRDRRPARSRRTRLPEGSGGSLQRPSGPPGCRLPGPLAGMAGSDRTLQGRPVRVQGAGP
jgi:methylmalonyl-CoA mutase